MFRGELSIRADQQGDLVVLTVAGEIDMVTAGALVDAGSAALAGGPREVVLDFHDVSFCDSAGIAALIRIYRQATAAGGTMRVRRTQATIRHVLQISGVDRVIPIDEEPARN
jgi:anti-anti-sigma factor